MYTNADLKQLITNLNSNCLDGFLSFQVLSNSVSKAQHLKPVKTEPHISPTNFYIIKNTRKKVVALIQDAYTDLFWYVLPGNRKKGYLTNALKSTIINHLFLNREGIKITINEGKIGNQMFLASQAVAMNCGFIKTYEGDKYYEYCLKKSQHYT